MNKSGWVRIVGSLLLVVFLGLSDIHYYSWQFWAIFTFYLVVTILIDWFSFTEGLDRGFEIGMEK